MSLLAPLVLAKDVILTPLVDLDPETRAGIDGADDDVAVSRPASRQPSVVVDAEAAALLGLFREPRTVADAVIHFSRPRQLDPDEVLTGAYPLVTRFFSNRVLEAADGGSAEEGTKAIAEGSEIGPWRVVRTVTRLDDVEVVQARDATGRVAALKVARSADGMAGRTLASEAAILEHLAAAAPDLAPEPWGRGLVGECAYLALAWCPGVDLTTAAAEARGAGPAAVTALLASVARAYARLHEAEVCHGDVHPRNLLVDGEGGVKLIDFGLGSGSFEESAGTEAGRDTASGPGHRPLGAPSPPSTVGRGGVGFYFEPEYAAAILAGNRPPAASPAGERYSLGALLYEAATGKPYLDFRLGRDELLGQIVSAPPLAFSARGVAPWPALEAVLALALAKDPAERFASTAELADSLAAVIPGERERRPESRPASRRPGQARPLPESKESLGAAAGLVPAGVGGVCREFRDSLSVPPEFPDEPLHRFVDAFTEELAEDGAWMRAGLVAPAASINYGAAGLALGLLRIAEARGDVCLLARAEAWLERAEALAGTEEGFFNPAIEITREVVGESSPYHSPAGVAAVRARFARAVGDRAGQAAAVRAFVELSERPPAGDDLTLGRSATVLGAAFVLDALPKGAAEGAAVLALGRCRLGEVWAHLDGEPEIADSALDNLGIAHGWAGFAYAALHWHRASGDPLPGDFGSRLNQLAALAEPSGRGLEWRWKLRGERLQMPGWCNGSAGHALLWSLAHRLIGEARFLDLAVGAGWNAWEASRSTLTTLCCGLAGRGYALLALHRATGEAAWLERARELARIGVAQAGRDPEYRYSLWKGDLGLATLVVDLDRPSEAAMPWFEDEGW
jgi:serine/threonine-protein kinase